VRGLFVLTIRQVSLDMLNRNTEVLPVHFTWSMWVDVRDKWCALMMPVVLWGWTLPVNEFIPLLIMAGVLVLIAIYDMRYGLIYDYLVWLLLLLSVCPLFLGHVALGTAGIGALLGGCLLGGLRLLSHGGLGWGDVKLAVPLGLWLGWEDLLLCLLLASVTGVIYGAWLLWDKRMDSSMPLPFGPFLSFGALTAFGWGNVIRGYIEAWLC